MEFDIAVKVELVDGSNDDEGNNLSRSQKQDMQSIAERSSCERGFKIKSEPDKTWDGKLNLYIDHQIKEEIVIGPTELYKQCNNLPHDHSLEMNHVCNKTKTRNLKNLHKIPKRTLVKQNRELEEKKLVIDEKVVNSTTADKKSVMTNEKEKKRQTKNKKLCDSNNKCNVCFKTFTWSTNLLRHMTQFHKNKVTKKYGCDKCGMSFTRSDYLIRHRLIKHSEGKNILYCKCGNKFYNKWSFTRHKKGYCVLRAAKPCTLFCDYCGKSFCNKYRLTEHVKKHLNDKYKTMICEYCEKNFHRKFEIERHMYQHLGLSLHKFKCDICNKKFTRNWSLKKHLISHSGRKPFSCKFCERPFASKWGCSSHEKQCSVLI